MKTTLNKFRKICVSTILLFSMLNSYAQTETLPTGSFIINMGTPVQTFNNGLRPYGLIWDIIKNNKAQVKWVISQTKLKDGVDFTYNAINYSGGTFIIPQKFITAAVQAKINALFPSVIAGVYTTSALTVDVTYTLKYTPRWTFDFANGSIAQAYLTNAGIPITSFPLKLPSQLNGCDDLFVMPHADPVWSTHKNLLTWNANSKGWIWAACHAVSAMENIYNPANPAQQLNFLSQNFTGFGVDQNAPSTYAGNSLVLWTTHAVPIIPFTYAYPSDPIMQFMGLVDGCVGGNGSERGYMPYNATSGGAVGRVATWRASTKIATYDNSAAATNPNIPEFTNGPVAEIAYGRAFGNNNSGFVMYEAGHNHDAVGTVAQKVAAQRAFLNFSFLSTYDKDPEPLPVGSGNIFSGVANSYSVSLAKPGYNLSDYSISWTSSCAGTFSNPYGATTTYTAAAIASCVTCVLTATVTDGCGRQFYQTIDVVVCPSPPEAIDLTTNVINNLPGTGQINLGSTTPLAGTDVDGTIVSYTVTTLPLVSQGVLYYNNGTSVVPLVANTVLTAAQMATLAFDPTDGFGGNATFNYTVTDNSGLIDATPATYTIPVNPPPVAQDIITTPINSTAGITPIGASLFATDNGTIASYTISSLPTVAQGILYLNGVPVTVGQVLTPIQASQLSFDPSGTYIGYVPFTYTATDNNGLIDPTPATVTIQIVNQAPEAQNITSPAIANPNGTGQTTIPALQATDVDGTIVSFTINSLPLITEGVLYYFNGTSYVPVIGGQTLTPAQASTLKFDPADGFIGNASFTYTATDNNGLVDSFPATYNIPVGIIPPLATDITNPAIYSGAGQTAINPLVGNDPDATNVIVSYTVTTLPLTSQGILYYDNGAGFVPVIAGVALTPVQMATLKFDPADGASGNVVFNYTVTDDEGLSDLSPASYTIPLINTAPVANNITNPTLNSTDGPITISPLTATDADGTIANFIITTLPLANQGILYLNGIPVIVGQVLTPTQAAQLTFDPTPGSGGTATFTYTTTDDQGAVDASPATFSIPINTVLVAPIANDIANTTIPVNAGATSILPLAATDADGTVVSYTITTLPPAAQGVLFLNGVAVTAGQIITPAQAAQLSFDPSGTYVGNVVFNYTATDNSGLVDATPAVVTIPIGNTPPVAQDISIPQIKTGTTVSLAPLAGTDVDGTIATFTISTLPTLGTLQVDLTGSGVFTAVTAGQILTPAQAARLRIIAGATVGTSTFTYTTTDNNGAVDLTPATYTIPIGAAADALGQPPIAADKLNTPINANAGVTATLALTATDPDGIIASYTILTVPPPYTGTLYYLAGGTVLTPITSGGFSLTPAEALTIRFDPSGTFVGNVSFTYTAIDNSDNIDPTPATYIIPIINTPPVATNITSAAMNSSAGATNISSLAATDADGTIANYTITTLPAASQGILYLNGIAITQGQIISVADAAKIQFDPNPLFSGNATFTFTAIDNLGAVDATPATFTIPVNNIAPIADDKLSQIITNTIGTPAVAIPNLTGSDIDGTIASYTIKSLPLNGVLYINGVAITTLPVGGLVITNTQATQLSFDPNDGFAGTASFTYTTTDNSGNVDATVANYSIPINTPPTTNNITTAAMNSTQGNTPIPAFVGADNGSIQFYSVTVLPPASQGALYLNGVLITSLSQVDTLSALQITQLSFTPAPTFTGTSFSYTATDNQGVIDVTPAVYSIPNKISISGSVWNDVNGGLTQDGIEAVINGTNIGVGVLTGAVLYANLVDASGTVIATTPIQADGSYTFSTTLTNTNLTIQLTTNQGVLGQPKPLTQLPVGWATTGENKNGFGGFTDGIANSEIVISTNNTNLITQNFGIEKLPESAVSSSAVGSNPGNFINTTIPANYFITSNVGVNPNTLDYNSGTVTSIRITTFPTNANSITIDGVVYINGGTCPTATTCVPWPIAGVTTAFTNGVGPTQPILIDPIDGLSLIVTIPFVAIDNAGKEDLTPGSVSLVYSTVVPIKMISFTVLPNGNQVNLQWVVSDQINISNYEVEFSSNGIKFEKITTVTSNASLTASYNAIHTSPILGINYYRIKTIEKDGSFSYSDIRKVNFGKANTVIVYPNPTTTGIVNISFKNSMVGKPTLVSLFSVDGKLISVQNILNTNQTETIKISNLLNGIFILRIETTNEIVNTKLEIRQ
jgi:Secretion system C-terminal sorting domain/Bacterial Ig domain